ncbi:DUF3810 domain-containing protein [Flavobacteriaceae bacterium F89]|uniref:DUF3810 domain-containing protein n=1 Tax=Cerina litoralis TaxID=2874477 RepID=A0AAE3JS64_9FLAO|nr:DUF3810 domain-containing protein [Cerina litoralis]MCG2462118.1 DUF3810 domain-containing protein [Cerina litoralis]
MNEKLKNGIALSLIFQVILVKWIGSHREWVEAYYSNGWYPLVSRFWRIILGWIPFSVGDLIYLGLLLLAIRYVVVQHKKIRKHPFLFLRNIVLVLSVAYFTFNLMWGLNYYREPLAKSMGLRDTITQEELVKFVEKLVKRTNEAQFRITKDTATKVEIPYSRSDIFTKTIEGYQSIGLLYPFLVYNNPSIKQSLFSTGLSYMGYAGYLNPFTNEAQVNGIMPKFRFPVVCGHEVGHQVGYSAENETNFIGFLVTVGNPDPYFQYAAYAYALSYCLSDVKRKDKVQFNRLYGDLNGGIKKNFKEEVDFWEAHANPMEPVFESIFDTFLKSNNQAQGIKSYRSIVSLLVTYYEDREL